MIDLKQARLVLIVLLALVATGVTVMVISSAWDADGETKVNYGPR